MQTNKKQQPGAHLYSYEVSGLTEWVALIAIGKARIRVPFTGGSMTGFGSTPARFRTTSSAIAKIIESSNYFKTGRIRRSQ